MKRKIDNIALNINKVKKIAKENDISIEQATNILLLSKIDELKEIIKKNDSKNSYSSYDSSITKKDLDDLGTRIMMAL